MIMAFISPAVAEIGCNSDRFVELSADSAATPEGDRDSDTSKHKGKATHCSFSHCAQGVASSPPARTLAVAVVDGTLYPPAPDDRFAAALVDGPERPPQA